jgi:outer membrane immunogenic protein
MGIFSRGLVSAAAVLAGSVVVQSQAVAADPIMMQVTDDLTQVGPPEEPAPPPPFAGFYFGGHAGMAIGNQQWAFVTHTQWNQPNAWDGFLADCVSNYGITGFCESTGVGTFFSSGWLAGGHVGFNTQSGAFVIGAEVGFDLGRVAATVENATFGAADDVYTGRINNLANASLRIGLAVRNVLMYVRGGYAGGNVSFGYTDDQTITGTWDTAAWHNGFQVGAGIEVQRNRRVFGIEYTLTRLVWVDHTGLTVSQGGGCGGICPDPQPRSLTYSVNAVAHQLALRFSFKLGGR